MDQDMNSQGGEALSGRGRVRGYVFFSLGLVALLTVLVILFFFRGQTRGQTMESLQHKVEKRWVENLAWEHGSVDDFQRVFGKPERFEEDFFSADFHALIYKCSDGKLVIIADDTSQDTGRSDIMQIREFVRVNNDKSIPPVMVMYHGDQVEYLPLREVLSEMDKIHE
jgi:hypothetical protein